MGRKILIDCYKVYETGENYSKDAEGIEQNQTKLTEIADTIETIWKGPDSYNFIISLRKHISQSECCPFSLPFNFVMHLAQHNKLCFLQKYCNSSL